MDIGEYKKTIQVTPAAIPVPRREQESRPDAQPMEIPEFQPAEPRKIGV